MVLSNNRHPKLPREVHGAPDKTPILDVTWYGGLTWTEGTSLPAPSGTPADDASKLYYGRFRPSSTMPRYGDISADGKPFTYGPVEVIDPACNNYHDYYGGSGWTEHDWCYATYGDPKDATTFPPPKNTEYHRYSDMECLVYGEPTDARPSPFPVVPEDARAIICELNPIRVNHIPDPNFKELLNRGEGSWHTAGRVNQAEHLGGPYSDSALIMWPGSLVEYGGFSDFKNAIYVGNTNPAGLGGQDSDIKNADKNLWKIAFATKARNKVFAGFKVLHSDGRFTITVGQTVPVARPWETLTGVPPSALEVTISVDPDPGVLDGSRKSALPEMHKSSPRIAGDVNKTPYSSTEWYTYYDVIDLGADALWAVPFVGVMSNSATGVISGPTPVASVIAERWDENWLLKGKLIPETIEHRPEVGENSVTYLKSDPLIFFDGDTGGVTSDFVWMGTHHKSASGYYPQRETRVQGLRKLMKSWLPLGRSLSVRYLYERP